MIVKQDCVIPTVNSTSVGMLEKTVWGSERNAFEGEIWNNACSGMKVSSVRQNDVMLTD